MSRETIKEDAKTILISLLVTFFIIGFAALLLSTINGRFSRLNDSCKSQFGNEYSYTNRRATDCVDSKGNGKFLKEL